MEPRARGAAARRGKAKVRRDETRDARRATRATRARATDFDLIRGATARRISRAGTRRRARGRVERWTTDD
jgi:hypothetical protein